MNSALNFSNKNKLINKIEFKNIKKYLKDSNLPWNLNKYFSKKDIGKILSFMTKDKKNNSNKINLVLLKKIGYPLVNQEYSKNRLKLFLKNELVD